MAKQTLSVTDFARKHRVSRMTVLRRIAEGELPATKTLVAPPRYGRPARYEWRVDANAKVNKYQAGRPAKLTEIEAAISGGKPPPHKRKPAQPARLSGLATVTSIFDRRGRRQG